MQPPVPSAVKKVVALLESAGHPSVLVGGCVRDRLRGVVPRDWDVATQASPEAVLALLPRAVPVGLRFGTVMLPTPSAGPVDITTWRGNSLEADLARRDFTINALAEVPASGTLIDPHGGRADLAAGRLCAVRSAQERLAEDPLRALRAARLVAELGLHADAALRCAMAQLGDDLDRVAGERLWSEIQRLLQAPYAERGLALLHETGLEAKLVPGVQPQAGPLVASLPSDAPRALSLRVAGWLRGCEGPSILARWRAPTALAATVLQILRQHPVEDRVAPRAPSVRRWIRRVGGEENAEAGLVLREAELALSPNGAASARLSTLRQLFLNVRGGALERCDLALDGRQVMAALGTGPGPRVGRALRFLTERILDDPSCNEPTRLRELLEAWQRDTAEPRPAGDR